MATKFEIHLTADGHTLTVAVNVPESTHEYALGALLAQLFRACHELEPTPDATGFDAFLGRLYFSGAGMDRRLLLMCPYTESDYPMQFENVLLRLSSATSIH